ncbi:MAG: ABC transporter ATP-binding protein [Candidatus Wallbacteria bacterium]|nr:ABC transporter ATP-binding protein [Candidatus Wallbacteria bacterium]
MIELSRLTKRFGGLAAVKELSLSIRPGTVFGFLGPNGAGKTTTLKMLMGMLPPTEGWARIDGLDVTADSVEVKRRVGFLPDSPAIYEYLTARELLQFIGTLHRIQKDELQERIAALLAEFGLEEKADELVLNYSKGMRKKLAILVALVHRPKVLLLDEPTNGLDPGSVRLLKDMVRREAARGTTILFSTHILEVAQEVSTELGIISSGRMVLLDSKEAIVRTAQARGETLEDLFLRLTGHRAMAE